MLYQHFQQTVVPGWLDKHRHRATHALDSMVLLSPHPDWVRSLPHFKLPDRQDFVRYAHASAQRMRLWRTAMAASEQLAEEFSAWVERPDVGVVGRCRFWIGSWTCSAPGSGVARGLGAQRAGRPMAACAAHPIGTKIPCFYKYFHFGWIFSAIAQ